MITIKIVFLKVVDADTYYRYYMFHYFLNIWRFIMTPFVVYFDQLLGTAHS